MCSDLIMIALIIPYAFKSLNQHIVIEHIYDISLHLCYIY